MQPMGNLQFILNSLGGGPMAQRLVASGMDPGVLRPYQGEDGRSYVTVMDGLNNDGTVKYKTMLTNTPALLRREDWLQIDKEVRWQAKQRLRFWADIYAANPYDVPNGWATLSLQHAVATGDADAIVSMDPIRKSERSRPILDMVSIPVPVIHSDGSFSARDLAVSQRSGMPLDSTNISLAARKVGEVVEKLALGTSASYSFANGTIYGALNFPQRNTYTMTSPESTSPAWTPKTVIDQILQMILQLENLFYYGPYAIYYSNAWGPYLNGDYSTLYPGITLRTRLLEIEKITEIKQVDYLPDFTMIIIQKTRDVVEGVVGMDIQTVQWEEGGGFEMMFKVLCIMFPRFRYDYSGHTGYIHASAAAPTTTTTSTTTTTTTTTAS